MMKTASNTDKLKGALADIRDLALIGAAILYFIGFIYIDAFYGEFGVSVTSAELPVYYVIVYSYDVLTALGWLTWVAFAAVVLLSTWLIWRFYNARICIFVLALAIAVAILGYGASAAGRKHAIEFRSGSGVNIIRLTFDPTKMRFLSKKLKSLNAQGKLWLLSATANRYLLLYQPRPVNRQLPIGTVFSLPARDVISAEIEVRNVPE